MTVCYEIERDHVARKKIILVTIQSRVLFWNRFRCNLFSIFGNNWFATRTNSHCHKRIYIFLRRGVHVQRKKVGWEHDSSCRFINSRLERARYTSRVERSNRQCQVEHDSSTFEEPETDIRWVETSFINHLKFVFSSSFRTINEAPLCRIREWLEFRSFLFFVSTLSISTDIYLAHANCDDISPREIWSTRTGQHNRRESGEKYEDQKFASSSIICPIWNVYRSFHCPPFHPPLWQDSHYIVFTGVGRISKEARPYPRLVPLLSNPTIYKPTYAPTIYAPMHFIPLLVVPSSSSFRSSSIPFR